MACRLKVMLTIARRCLQWSNAGVSRNTKQVNLAVLQCVAGFSCAQRRVTHLARVLNIPHLEQLAQLEGIAIAAAHFALQPLPHVGQRALQPCPAHPSFGHKRQQPLQA